ncbi:hypothetical protein [Streptomyces sp. enrichment culture]|uniref:hypothetical protein n=1 Tax=Streptomyces sp. enrichment culture TaxID=1795815 RepID=UPI003F5431F8
MTSSGSAVRLTATVAEAFVKDWLGRLAAGAPAEELLPALANGMRLELPTEIVRGSAEFRAWYESGRHGPLTDRLTEASWEAGVTSPVHAQLTLTVPAGDGTGTCRQEWWVVRQNGVLRVRTIVVTAPVTRPAAGPAPASSVAEPAYA